METKLYVANISASAILEDLKVLFSQAGDVTSVEVIKDSKRGLPKGFAFITTSSQSQADKAVSKFLP